MDDPYLIQGQAVDKLQIATFLDPRNLFGTLIYIWVPGNIWDPGTYLGPPELFWAPGIIWEPWDIFGSPLNYLGPTGPFGTSGT